MFSHMLINLKHWLIFSVKRVTQEDFDNWLDEYKDYYNSVFTTDENGVVQIMSPETVPIIRVCVGYENCNQVDEAGVGK